MLVNGRVLTVDATARWHRPSLSRRKDRRCRHQRSDSRACRQPDAGDRFARRAATPGLIDTHVPSRGRQRCHRRSQRRDIGRWTTPRACAAQVAKTKAASGSRRGWTKASLRARYVTAADLDRFRRTIRSARHTTATWRSEQLRVKMAEVRRDTKIRRPHDRPRRARQSDRGDEGSGHRHGDTPRPPVTREQQRQGMCGDRGLQQGGQTGARIPASTSRSGHLPGSCRRRTSSRTHFALWSGAQRKGADQCLPGRGVPRRRIIRRGVLISGGVKMFRTGAAARERRGCTRTGTRTRGQRHRKLDTRRSIRRLPPDRRGPAQKRRHSRSTHASGIAPSTGMDTYELALTRSRRKGLRHGIIHDNTRPTTPSPSRRGAEGARRAYPESQSEFMWWIATTMLAIWDRARAATVAVPNVRAEGTAGRRLRLSSRPIRRGTAVVVPVARKRSTARTGRPAAAGVVDIKIALRRTLHGRRNSCSSTIASDRSRSAGRRHRVWTAILTLRRQTVSGYALRADAVPGAHRLSRALEARPQPLSRAGIIVP